MTTEFKPFHCPDCNGLVELRMRPDLTREIAPGRHVHLPENMPVPSCRGCNEVFLNARLAATLDAVLRAQGPCIGATYRGDDILETVRRAHERCGQPAVRLTVWGARCEACFAADEAARRDPNTLGSILAQAARSKPSHE